MRQSLLQFGALPPALRAGSRLSTILFGSRSMAYLPLPGPSRLLKRAIPPLQPLLQSYLIQPSEVSAIFSKLRQILDDGAQPLDFIVRALTDAARVMTGANGIALALRSKGTVVCQARAV